LSEAEDVIDEQQRISAFLVAEVLSHRETRQGNTQARSRRFRHLAVDQSSLGVAGITRLDYARFSHLQPEVVSFSGTLAHSGKHGVSAVLLGYVVDQFHDHDGLADAGAAEQSDFAALQKRLDQINHLHAGFKHLRRSGLLFKRRRRTVNGELLVRLHRAKIIYGLANHIDHAAERPFAYRNGNRASQVDHLHAAHHAVRGLHGDAAHAPFTQVLLHLENHVDGRRDFETFAGYVQCLINRWEMSFTELHVHRGTGDLHDSSNVLCHKPFLLPLCLAGSRFVRLPLCCLIVLNFAATQPANSRPGRYFLSGSRSAADDLDNLFCDFGLAHAIHLQSEAVNHV